MFMTWRFSEARTRLSELFRLAHFEGPQRIRRDHETVVVLTEAEYLRLRGVRPSFKEHLLSGPSWEGIDLTRDRRPM
jgi:hypothetical protein